MGVPHSIGGSTGAGVAGDATTGSGFLLPGNLSPWNQRPYLTLPTETQFQLTTTPQQVVKGDDHRIRLIIAVNISGTGATTIPNQIATISTSPSGPPGQGIPITQGGQYVLLTWEVHGVLVQQPWWIAQDASITGNLSCTVMAYGLIDWPGESKPNILEQVDNGTFVDPADRARAASITRLARQRPLTDDELMQLIATCSSGYPQAADGSGYLPPPQWGIPQE